MSQLSPINRNPQQHSNRLQLGRRRSSSFNCIPPHSHAKQRLSVARSLALALHTAHADDKLRENTDGKTKREIWKH